MMLLKIAYSKNRYNMTQSRLSDTVRLVTRERLLHFANGSLFIDLFDFMILCNCRLIA